MELLRQTIRPEFLNRVDEVIMFQPFLKTEIKGIIRIQLDNLSKMLIKKRSRFEIHRLYTGLSGRKRI